MRNTQTPHQPRMEQYQKPAKKKRVQQEKSYGDGKCQRNQKGSGVGCSKKPEMKKWGKAVNCTHR